MENKEKEIDLVQLFKTIWSRRRTVIKWGVVFFVLGIVIALSLPREYQSTIKIVLENKTDNSGNTMGALAGMMGVNVNIGGNSKEGINENIYPEIIKSSPFALEFANIPVVYEEQTIPMWQYMFDCQKQPWWNYVTGAPRAFMNLFGKSISDTAHINNNVELQRLFVELFTAKLKVENDTKTKTYTMTATMQDPTISKIVADSMLVKLQRYVTNYRTAKTKYNLEQNIATLCQVRQSYYNADSIYANALDRNQNLVSRSAQMRLDRLNNERNLAFSVYQQLATQVEVDRLKLQEETPIATVIEPSYKPLIPAKPSRKLVVAVVTMLGMFGAVAGITIREVFK